MEWILILSRVSGVRCQVSGLFSRFWVGRATAWRGEASAKTGVRQNLIIEYI
jgi:hypothetical protein